MTIISLYFYFNPLPLLFVPLFSIICILFQAILNQHITLSKT